MAEEPSVRALVAEAARGDQTAWGALVDRYAGLVVAVARGHGLSESDVADVSQTVWLRLVEQLGALREPNALGGWLVTTAGRESLRVLRMARRQTPTDLSVDFDLADDVERTATDRGLLDAERDSALREAFAQLPEPCQALLELLLSDPPLPYAEISRRLAMPVGSIGPTRARCLERVRQCPALVRLLAFEDMTEGGGDGHDECIVGRR